MNTQLCANPTQCIIITIITSTTTAVANRNSKPYPHTGDEYSRACGLIASNITNLLIFIFTITKKHQMLVLQSAQLTILTS
jgi:hypothetical protein